MRTIIKTIGVFFLLILLNSCSTAPEPIYYGKDQCNFCKMNIVDKQHAAQYVTKKGKQFKFDAVECLVNEINKKDNESDLAIILVADYGNPGQMTDAKSATYLISKNIKSPMGAFLSAFSDRQVAEKTKAEMKGTLYNWDALKDQLKNQ